MISAAARRRKGIPVVQADTRDDLLDFAILWAPIDGPSAEQIRAKFSLAVEEYRQRLCEVVQAHRRTHGMKGNRAFPDRVYAVSVLDSLLREYAT